MDKKDIRDMIVSVAKTEIGETETPKDSNKTHYGAWFGLNGVAWCGMFVSWCYAQAGFPIKGGGFSKGFAGCQTAWTNFKSKETKTPERGDVVLFDWNGDGRYDHTGIFVKKLNDHQFETIEGNTAVGNDSNGGQVMSRIRNFKNAKFLNLIG